MINQNSKNNLTKSENTNQFIKNKSLEKVIKAEVKNMCYR